MFRIEVELVKPLSTKYISAYGIKGLFFYVLRNYDADQAMELHDYSSHAYLINNTNYPDAYSIRKIVRDKRLYALQINCYVEGVAAFIYEAFKAQIGQEKSLSLGSAPVGIKSVVIEKGSSFAQFASLQPVNQIAFYFESPTVFNQNNKQCLFPEPQRMFTQHSGPVRVWEHFASSDLKMPRNWLEWFYEHVFVARHDIRTVSIPFNHKSAFVGFVGVVVLQVSINAPSHYLTHWNGLAHLAEYSGFGRKVNMGMGSVSLKPFAC